MGFYDLIFWLFAFISVASAALMVFSKNVIYSAVGLLFAFFGVAGIYVLLAADFLAIIQIMIYVGGILVLLLFGVMLSHKIGGVQLETGTLHKIPAFIVVGGIFIILFRVISKTVWPLGTAAKEFNPTVEKIGTLLMTDYLIPFEIVSVMLLIALIGAAYIARKERVQ